MIPNRFSRSLSILVTLLFVASISVAPALGSGRHKLARDERSLLIYGLIRQVHDQADNFEKALKPSLKVSVFRGSSQQAELIDRADNIKFGAHQLRNEFKEGQSNDVMRPEISDLFVAAERLNIVIQNVNIGAPAMAQWSQLRDALNNLGAVYGLRQLDTVSYVAQAD
jgi:hypothetical protein